MKRTCLESYQKKNKKNPKKTLKMFCPCSLTNSFSYLQCYQIIQNIFMVIKEQKQSKALALWFRHSYHNTSQESPVAKTLQCSTQPASSCTSTWGSMTLRSLLCTVVTGLCSFLPPTAHSTEFSGWMCTTHKNLIAKKWNEENLITPLSHF